MMDLADGDVTLIADQPAPGLTYCGSPAWSHDGRRILFDASPGPDFSLTRLHSIELGAVRPTVADIGAGNCPTWSSADDRIAFLSNVKGVQGGIWLMKADGSERHPLGEYGIPKWSPAGNQMMIVGFGEFDAERDVTIMDADPQKSGRAALPRWPSIRSVPSWAGKGTIVAVIGAAEGDRIALIDVSVPGSGSASGQASALAEGRWTRHQAGLRDLFGCLPPLRLRRALGPKRHVPVFGPGGPARRPGEAAGKGPDRKMIVNLEYSPGRAKYVLYPSTARPDDRGMTPDVGAQAPISGTIRKQRLAPGLPLKTLCGEGTSRL